MSARAYLSNLSRRWPFERQEATHAESTPGWPDVPTYRDKLSTRKRMAHRPAALLERASLLRPSSRGEDETIYVASLAVIAIGAEDFLSVVAAAEARRATILSHEDSVRIEPFTTAHGMHELLAKFLHSKRRSDLSGEQWKPGNAASLALRAADVQRRIELIREDWGKREIPTRALLERAGRKIGRRRDLVPMSYITAAKILGKRPAAQKKREVDLYREQKRQEAVGRRKGENEGEDQ